MKDICRILLSMVLGCLLAACTSDGDDAMMRDGRYVYVLNLQGGVTGYGETTRATKVWKTGDVIYLRFSTSATAVGTATYKDGVWTLVVDKELQGSGTCQAVMFDNVVQTVGDVVDMAVETAVYQDEAGQWSRTGNTLSVTAHLSPKLGRLRLKGDKGTGYSLEGLTTYTSYNCRTGQFTTTQNAVSGVIGSAGYSGYIHGLLTNTTSPTLHLNGYAMVCPSTMMTPGQSGWLNYPTDSNHAGWTMDSNIHDEYNLIIGGIEVTEDNKDNVIQGINVSFNPTTRTLSLKGTAITVEGDGAGLVVKSPITIELTGKNKITVENSENAIELFADMTITGDGSLEIVSKKGTGIAYHGNVCLTIENTNVTVNGAVYGIGAAKTKGELVVKNSSVIVEGAKAAIIGITSSPVSEENNSTFLNQVAFSEQYGGVIDLVTFDYAKKVEITTLDNISVHDYVDLGLSVKWATCNIGAENPEDYGDYYAWGETETKSNYSWGTYKWYKEADDSMTKYCTSSSYGTADNKTELAPEDDVAHAKWGGQWRMPTDAECDELKKKCSWAWTSKNGHWGYIVTSSNGNSIFLPAAGYRDYEMDIPCSVNSIGDYWSSTLSSSRSDRACTLYFSDSYLGSTGSANRRDGLSVRPVCQ